VYLILRPSYLIFSCYKNILEAAAYAALRWVIK